MSEEVNEKYHPRNTMAQLSTPTPTPSATVHSVTDGRTDGQRETEDSVMPIAEYTVSVTIVSSKIGQHLVCVVTQ